MLIPTELHWFRLGSEWGQEKFFFSRRKIIIHLPKQKEIFRQIWHGAIDNSGVYMELKFYIGQLVYNLFIENISEKQMKLRYFTK